MKWKAIYEENKNREIDEIEAILSDFALKTSLKNLWMNNKKIILISSIIIIILLTFTFYKNIQTLLYVLVFLLFLILSSVFFLSFSITAKSKIMKIYTNGEEVKIPYDKIKNIYLKQNIDKIFFKKIYYYSIVILYKTPNNNICDIHLSTFLVNKEDFRKCLEKIKTKKTKINYQEKCNNYKRKRFKKKIIILLILTLLLIIIGIFSGKIFTY